MFDEGIVIFFRQMTKDDNLARCVLPAARTIGLRYGEAHPEDYIVRDENDELLGVFPRDWVAAILPLVTEGIAANASNQPPRRDNSASTEERNTEIFSRRAKRSNP